MIGGFYFKMGEDKLLRKIKEAGFQTIDEFVKANLHYLSQDKQKLFYDVISSKNEIYKTRLSNKSCYKTNY